MQTKRVTTLTTLTAARGMAASGMAAIGFEHYGAETLQFFAFFASVSVISTVVLRAFGWREGEQRFMITSSCVALCHGAFVFNQALQQVWSKPYTLDAANTPIQETIMAFSTGYFLVDMFYLLIFMPKEVLYMAHHLMCLLYMVSVVAVGRGSFSVMALMALGEITNPFHNVWHILKEILKEKDAPRWAKQANSFVEPMLNGTYSFARLLLSPIMALHLAFTFLFTTSGIAYPLLVFWSIIALGIVAGSQGEAQERAKAFYTTCTGQ